MKASLFLGIKCLMRQWQGRLITLLSASFIICIALMSGMNILGARLGIMMQDQASTLMGADVVLSSSQPISSAVREKASSFNLTHTSLVEFLTMTLSDETPILAIVKAVNSPYPLMGELSLTTPSSQPLPGSGEIWLHQDWQSRFGIEINDILEIGDKSFRVTHFIEKEPEMGANLFNIAPRILMNQTDLDATGVIQPGSRVNYRMQCIGNSRDLSAFMDWLKPNLTPNDELVDLKEDRPELANTIERAQRYLILVAFSSIILAGSSILLILKEYTESQERTVSLLRTLGVKQQQLFIIYFGSLISVGFVLGVIGTILGYGLQGGIAVLLEMKLGLILPSAPLAEGFLGIATALILMTGFSLPALSGLIKQSPLTIFHAQNQAPLASQLLFGSCISAVLLVILTLYTQDFFFSFVTLILFIGLYLISDSVMRFTLDKLASLKSFLSLPYKLTLSRILLHKSQTIIKILGLSLSLTLILLLTFIRFDLLSQWKKSFPDNPPNHYVFNILPTDASALITLLDHKKIQHTEFFPIVKARLLGFDDFPPGEAPNYLKRELNNTTLPKPRDIDTLVSGKWWDPETNESWVSVEKSIAEELHLELGQTLNFTLADKSFSARIANIREVNWENFQPNFYMIFSAFALKDYPRTFLTSLYLGSDKSILTDIARSFPSATVISVEDVLKQVQQVVNESSLYMTALLLVILATSIMLVFTTGRIQLQSRLKESALLMRLGVSRQQLKRGILAEFLFTSFLATTLSFLIASLLIFFMGVELFHSGVAVLPWVYFPLAWGFVLLIQFFTSINILPHTPQRK